MIPVVQLVQGVLQVLQLVHQAVTNENGLYRTPPFSSDRSPQSVRTFVESWRMIVPSAHLPSWPRRCDGGRNRRSPTPAVQPTPPPLPQRRPQGTNHGGYPHILSNPYDCTWRV